MFVWSSHFGKASVDNAHDGVVDVSRWLGGVDTGVDAFLLVVIHQRFRLLVISLQSLPQYGFIIIRPFD